MWKLTITTTSQAEDAVAELVERVFGQPAAVHTNIATGRAEVTIYCETRPPDLPLKRIALRGGLVRIKRCGLKVGSGRVRVRRFRRENWAESWKCHFKPIEIGDALLVKPSWGKCAPRRGQATVMLDPGLSFGTGHHPTTAFCLWELARRRARGQPQAFLDLGTGSGILAIAAAKLGYSRVDAIDSDPEAVRVARANARRNRVSRKVRLVHQDLTRLPLRPARRYDLICANLLSKLLLAERNRMVRRLKPGGVLVVAGILGSEFNRIARIYRHVGLRLVGSRTEKEWRSGAFMTGR